MIGSGVGVRRLVSLAAVGALAMVVSWLATLALAVAPASALETRLPVFSFNVLKPSGVAVDQSDGDVYVVDGEAKAVRKFDAKGNPVDFAALGSNELPVTGLSHTGSLAVDPGNGDVYVGYSTKVARFTASGEPADFTAGPAAGTNVLTGADDPSKHLGTVAGLAVNSAGELFVSQNTSPGAVDEFASSGAYGGLEIVGSALKYPRSIALNATGAIYDIENGTGDVLEFNSVGSLIGTCDASSLAKEESLAVEPAAGEVLVSHGVSAPRSEEIATVVQYSEGCAAKQLEFRYAFGSAAQTYIAGQLVIAGLAVNSTSTADPADEDVYVSNNAKGLVEVFGPPTVVPDVAVQPVSNIGVGVATLNGTVDSDGTGAAEALTSCRFEYVTEAAFQADVSKGGDGFSSLASGGSVPCASVDGKAISNPGEIPNDDKGHSVSAEISSLPANTAYHVRLEAGNASGVNPDAPQLSFETAGPPTIEETYATAVNDTTAEVSMEVDPHLLATTYELQYVSEAAYLEDVETLGAGHGFDHATSVPEAPAELSGTNTRIASVLLSGLEPSTTYRYRAIVANGFTPQGVEGPELTLTTEPLGQALELPDDRAWELVSPTNKHGAVLVPLGSTTTQAATDGSAITYEMSTPTDSEVEGYSSEGAQMVSTRGQDGWSSRDITVAHETVTGSETEPEYKLFSPDFTQALVNPVSDNGGQVENTTLLSAHASAATPYIRNAASCAAEASAGECFMPLFTGKEGFADVPLGTVFGTETANLLTVEATTPSLEHVVVLSSAALTATTTPKGELYEWSANTPASEAVQLVSLLPEAEGGEPATSAQVVVGGNIASALPGEKGARNAIANDGSRIFWEAGSGSRALYMRDTLKHETIRLDVRQPGAPAGGSPEPTFQLATGAGTRAFFTDEQPLTADSGTGDLYLCEIVEEASTDACRLTDLTPKVGAESAEVRQLALGASEDGSYIYFVANGVLAPGATHGQCRLYEARSAVCNLYVAHEEAGSWAVKLVATLSIEDEGDWGTNTSTSISISRMTARVSPNGRYVAFMSQRSLTGYDNHDVRTGKPDEEVYLYDAQSKHLGCVSCNPTGQRPDGIELDKLVKGGLDFVDVHAGEGALSVAASLPGADAIGSAGTGALYQPRLLFDDGRLFFNSSDALVSQDINGGEDVYEFELPGDGTCTTSAVTYSERSGGCVSLISSGVSAVESGFLDASASGDDAFFVTAEKLMSGDADTAFDVYDAHVCTAEAPCSSSATASPECTTAEACRAAPMPQPSIFGAPPSATFSGAGNQAASTQQSKAVKRRGLTRAQKRRRALKACRKKRGGKRRRSCKRRVRRKYAAKGSSRKAGKSKHKSGANASGRGRR